MKVDNAFDKTELNDTQQNAYDWKSLQDYLPPNQKAMEDGIAAVQNILSQY